MGAHPYSLFNPGVPPVEGYVEHRTAMASAAKASPNPAGSRRWIDEWIIEPGSHDRYLAMLGTERQRTLRYQAQPDYGRDEAEHAGAAIGPAGHSEAHVIVAGRYIAERIAACANEMVLSGVGQANLASWLGVDAARRDGHAAELMAEIGMAGYTSRPGEPFVFAHRNYYTSTMLTDSMTVLGSLIAGPGTRSLGVFGAGQVGQQGNVNSAYAADGRFLAGSGGANDIAAGADEVVIVTSHSPSRLAGELPYVTSPGQAVRAVTDLGVFERAEDGLVPTRLLPASGSDERDALAVMRARSGWDFPVARRLTREREPEAHELTLLRAFRPSRRLHWKLTTRRPNIPPMGAYSGQGAAR